MNQLVFSEKWGEPYYKEQRMSTHKDAIIPWITPTT